MSLSVCFHSPNYDDRVGDKNIIILASLDICMVSSSSSAVGLYGFVVLSTRNVI
jgi:hypothetical protein